MCLILWIYATHWGPWRLGLRGPPWFVAWRWSTARAWGVWGDSRDAEGCPSGPREGPRWCHCRWEKRAREASPPHTRFHSGGRWGSRLLPVGPAAASAGWKALSAIISLSAWETTTDSFSKRPAEHVKEEQYTAHTRAQTAIPPPSAAFTSDIRDHHGLTHIWVLGWPCVMVAMASRSLETQDSVVLIKQPVEQLDAITILEWDRDI